MYTKEEYQKYIKQKSPKSNILKNILWAFIVGGLICVLGQAVDDFFKKVVCVSAEDVKIIMPVTMIFLGAFFTGLNLYDNLAKHAGGGTLVPITGFSNAIVAPAMEFKSEGYVLGLASRMFVVAGPVLVYGVLSSVIIGLLYELGVNL